jgi:hypothetical protein
MKRLKLGKFRCEPVQQAECCASSTAHTGDCPPDVALQYIRCLRLANKHATEAGTLHEAEQLPTNPSVIESSKPQHVCQIRLLPESRQ